MSDEIRKPKHCLLCASEIPAGAKKCSVCGSYQSARRYIDFSNATLALVVAFLGLLTALPATITSLASTAKDALSADHLGRVLTLDENQASIYVRNVSGHDAVVTEIQCLLRLERQRGTVVNRLLLSRASPDDQVETGLELREAMNPLLVTYEVSPTIIPTGESRVLVLDRSNWAFVAPYEPSDGLAISYCGFGFGIDDPNSEVDLHLLDARQLTLFDTELAVSQAEITSIAKTDRAELRALITNP